MRIVTWNVNGIRACIIKGFEESVKALKPDVICIQEVKAYKESVKLDFDGYDIYWNSSRRSGYSGVAILCNQAVHSVREGLGDDKFDIEGRLLTLEFDDFFLLNTYMPMSKGRLARSDYRNEWDDALFEFIKKLSKPAIICGDFNVAHTYQDIYPENNKNLPNPAGFSEIERENFERLINYGFVDVFRSRHPRKRQYTWWSNRLNKREENKGWRIDYFLVHETLHQHVTGMKICDEVLGSDHCPMLLDLDITVDAMANRYRRKMTADWESIDWRLYEKRVFEVQKEMAQDVVNLRRSDSYILAEKILDMPEARALAVKRVSDANSETGVDGVRFSTSYQKMKEAKYLDARNCTPSPMKSVVIFDGKKERRINIPTYRDRAFGVLLKMALEPIAESTSDRKSFAFRKGRSTFDACSYVEKALQDCPNLWVLKGDIKSYYDTICHEFIFKKLPLHNIIRKFLKAGLMMNGELFPSEQGISQGLALSTVLANMVLDGMQNHVRLEVFQGKDVKSYTHGEMIRFADDFVFFADSKKQALQIKEAVEDFLAIRGLKLSEEKTTISSARDGFDFLGWHFVQREIGVKTTPAEASVTYFENNISTKILSHTSSLEALIKTVNKSIIGFANYHRHTDCEECFRHLDVFVSAVLIQKVKNMHPKQAWIKLSKIYWYTDEKGNNIFAHPDKKHLQILQFKKIERVFHFAIKTTFNCFIEEEYLRNLSQKRQEDKRSGKNTKIWNSQGGKCYFCGKPILADQFVKLVKTTNTHKLAYIHSRCKNNVFEYRLTDEYAEKIDLLGTLNKLLQSANRIETNNLCYIGVKLFFAKEERQVFTLTFVDIEKLLGDNLPAEAMEEFFWYDKHFESLAIAWLDNGYIIQRLDLEKKKVIFRKDNHNLTSVKLPQALKNNKIPKNAQDEIEAFLKYIANKYRL